jgi:hypothetical protein
MAAPGTKRISKWEALAVALLLSLVGVLGMSSPAGNVEAGLKVEPQKQMERGVNCKGKGKRVLPRVCLA